MEPSAIAQTILDIGGWGAFLTLAIALGIAVWKGILVPGRYYDREVTRGDKLEAESRKNAESIERLTVSIDAIVESALRSRRA